MATSQLAENQQCSYEVFGKKHYMACTTQKRAAFQVMGSKTMQCSPAFPLPRPMLGFKAFDAAQGTLVGIELMHMIRKRQMIMEAGEEGLTAAELFYSLAA
jgi:hypothetical protein